MKKIVLAAAVVALSAGSAFAATPSGNTSTLTGSANATVIAPIVLTHTSGAALSFGTFSAGTGGTVEVTSGGTGTVTADVGEVTGSSYSADGFTIAGDNGRSFTVTTASGTVARTGGGSMTFTTSPSISTGTLDSTTGEATFAVGGILTVGSGQTAGAYSGTYDVTVTYD
jgi:hypothetical protein